MIREVIGIVGMFFYLIMIPMCIGGLLISQIKGTSKVAIYVYGMLAEMSLFQLASVPLILLHRSLREAIILWSILLLALIAFLTKKNIKNLSKFTLKFQMTWAWQEIIMLLICMVLIVIACGHYLFGMHIDDDDARYVANALAAYESNTMYFYHPNNGSQMEYFMGEIGKEVTSPLMIFYAAISFIGKIHPTIMIHTIWPIIWFIVSVSLVWVIGEILFPKERSYQLLFLMVVLVLQQWGNVTVYTASTFTLIRLWQGKALVPAIIVPFLLFIFLKLKKAEDFHFWELLIVNMSACLCSGMGCYLLAVMTCVVSLVWSIREKNVQILVKGCLCCIPNAVYTFLYVLVHLNIIR